MIRVIMSPDVLRDRPGSYSWRGRATAFAVGGVVAGVAMGALVGALGQLLLSTSNRAVALAFGVALAPLALLEAAGWRPPLLQRDRESPGHWLRIHPRLGAGLTGGWLSLAVVTRIGFSIVYVVPLAAFLSADWRAGALIWGAYGLSRSLGGIALSELSHRLRPRLGVHSMIALGEPLLASATVARRLSGTVLLAGMVVFVATSVIN